MNNTIKVIAVPTDFSPKSQNAVKMAVEMATRHQAKLIICHVIYHFFVTDRTGRQLLGQNAIQQHTEKSEQALKRLVEGLKHKNIEIETKILYGNLVESINRLADHERADVLVMGTWKAEF